MSWEPRKPQAADTVHTCDRPNASDILTNRSQPGDVWQCMACGRRWELLNVGVFGLPPRRQRLTRGRVQLARFGYSDVRAPTWRDAGPGDDLSWIKTEQIESVWQLMARWWRGKSRRGDRSRDQGR